MFHGTVLSRQHTYCRFTISHAIKMVAEILFKKLHTDECRMQSLHLVIEKKYSHFSTCQIASPFSTRNAASNGLVSRYIQQVAKHRETSLQTITNFRLDVARLKVARSTQYFLQIFLLSHRTTLRGSPCKKFD